MKSLAVILSILALGGCKTVSQFTESKQASSAGAADENTAASSSSTAPSSSSDSAPVTTQGNPPPNSDSTPTSQAAPSLYGRHLYKETLGMAGIYTWAGDWRAAITRAQGIGITSIRFGINWKTVETVANTYDFSLYDQLYTAAANAGMRVNFSLNYNNNLYSQFISTNVQTGITTQANRDAFARFAAAAAAHFIGKNITWEIWNEPDRPEFWSNSPDPVAYAALVQAAVRAIRQVDPKASIVNGGFGNQYWNSNFIQTAMQNGMLNGLSALAVHSYDAFNAAFSVETQEIWHSRFKTWMSQYNNGNVLPIIDTEFGAPWSWLNTSTAQIPDKVDYTAKVSVRMTLDNYYMGMEVSHAFGMMAQEPDLNLSTDVPAYLAYKYINALLGPLEGKNLSLGNNLRALSFTNRADRPFANVVVAWYMGSAQALGSATVTFSSPMQVSGVYDVYGNQLSGPGTISSYTVSELGGPVFFVAAGSH